MNKFNKLKKSVGKLQKLLYYVKNKVDQRRNLELFIDSQKIEYKYNIILNSLNLLEFGQIHSI